MGGGWLDDCYKDNWWAQVLTGVPQGGGPGPTMFDAPAGDHRFLEILTSSVGLLLKGRKTAGLRAGGGA